MEDSKLQKLKDGYNKWSWYTLPNITLNVQGADEDGTHYYARQENIDSLIEFVFSAGRLQALSEAEGVVPEEESTNSGGYETVTKAIAHNQCRQQMLDNIAKLREGK